MKTKAIFNGFTFTTSSGTLQSTGGELTIEQTLPELQACQTHEKTMTPMVFNEIEKFMKSMPDHIRAFGTAVTAVERQQFMARHGRDTMIETFKGETEIISENKELSDAEKLIQIKALTKKMIEGTYLEG